MYDVRGKEGKQDMRYKVMTIKDASTRYFYIRDMESMDIVELPTKYLTHKTRAKRSPNTVRRSAFAILYYLEYLLEKEMEIADVYQLAYDEQTEHFVNFLYWLKEGNHTKGNLTKEKQNKFPNNGTCNAYLKDVFRFYLFIQAEYEQYGSLKALSYNRIMPVNEVGVKRVLRSHSFKGYLKAEEGRGKTAKQNDMLGRMEKKTGIKITPQC